MRRGWLVIALALVVLGAILRLIHLDADPAYRLWAGYISDEGRWTEQARQLALFGELGPATDLAMLHLLLAPLYQAATVIPFSLFGVGFASARLVSAVSGIVLLVAAFLFLRRRLSAEGLVVVLAVLALQPDLLFLSRVAIPEMAALLFSFLAFACLTSARGSRKRLLAAGLLTLVAAGFKATTAPLIPIFAVVAWILEREPGAGRGWSAAGAYLAGAFSPVLLALVLVLASDGGGLAGRLVAAWSTLGGFVRIESPYGAVAKLVYGPVPSVTGALILAVWLLAGLLLAVGRLPRSRAREVWIGSAIWVAGWFGLSAVLDYFPERYVIHALVPMALNLGAGLSLLQDIGSRERARGLERLSGRRRAVVAAWLSLPLAVVLAPLPIAVAAAAGILLDRLTHHLIVVGVIGAVVMAIWTRGWQQGRHAPLLVALPLVVVGLRVLLTGAGLMTTTFWSPAGASQLAAWIALFVTSVGLVAVIRVAPIGMIVGAAAVYGAALTVTWLARTPQGLAAPTYTIRDAGAVIEELAPEGGPVGSVSAAGVFLNTRVRYDEYIPRHSLPHLLVAVIDPIPADIAPRYRLERRLDLELNHEGVDSRLMIYRLTEQHRGNVDARSSPFHSEGLPGNP